MLRLCCAAGLFVLISQAEGQVPNNIGEIEANVLAGRRAIKSGNIVIQSQMRDGTYSSERVWTVYFMGKNIRQDVKTRYDVVPKGVTDADYVDTTCFTDDSLISCSNQIMPDGGIMVLAIRDLKEMKAESVFDVVDPRILGLAPLDFQTSSRMYRVDSFIASRNRENVLLSRDVKDGIECWKEEFKSPGFSGTRAWIAPTKGYSIVRMEQGFTAGGTNYLDSVELAIKKHEKSGIWFPASQHYQRVEDGDRVTREEHLKVTIVSLNEALESKVFTPAGMSIRPDTPVMFLPEKGTGRYVWDGNRIVKANEELYPTTHATGAANGCCLPVFLFYSF